MKLLYIYPILYSVQVLMVLSEMLFHNFVILLKYTTTTMLRLARAGFGNFGIAFFGNYILIVIC